MKSILPLFVFVDACGWEIIRDDPFVREFAPHRKRLASVFGYTNASWTLKADLVCEYVCRLLKRMDRGGYRQCMPHNDDPTLKEEPWVNFSSGYIQRALPKQPKQGSKRPWKLYQNYALDLLSLRFGSVRDRAMVFSP